MDQDWGKACAEHSLSGPARCSSLMLSSLSLGFMLLYHTSTEELLNSPHIISEDVLQDMPCMLSQQGRWLCLWHLELAISHSWTCPQNGMRKTVNDWLWEVNYSSNGVFPLDSNIFCATYALAHIPWICFACFGVGRGGCFLDVLVVSLGFNVCAISPAHT